MLEQERCREACGANTCSTYQVMIDAFQLRFSVLSKLHGEQECKLKVLVVDIIKATYVFFLHIKDLANYIKELAII